MISVLNDSIARVRQSMTKTRMTCGLCLRLALAAMCAVPLAGCYVPGGGWTLRAGCDLREHRKPALYVELVDAHWDEQRRVAAFNAGWNDGALLPLPAPAQPGGQRVLQQHAPPAAAPTFQPQAPPPMPPAPAAPPTGAIPPPLPPVESPDSTVSTTSAAGSDLLQPPRLALPAAGSENQAGDMPWPPPDEESAPLLQEEQLDEGIWLSRQRNANTPRILGAAYVAAEAGQDAPQGWLNRGAASGPATQRGTARALFRRPAAR